MPPISTQLHPHENLQRPSHTRPSSPRTRVPSRGQAPSTVLYTFAQPSATSSISPSSRYPLTRPLSPDLPIRDALYLFSNFSSYMRSPHEGAEGIASSADFRDTIRLLDFARHYAATPQHNVHILHLKYRFQSQSQVFRSPYASGDYRLPMNYRDSTGRLRNPVPQPFSTLNDPVIKVDYKENGVFEPLPAEAIFRHIATVCQPPPRIIVFSYVCSHVTQNHLAALSTWALASSPPAYIFSPLETRIRENQSLPIALHHAIPMSMYACPPSTPSASPTNTTNNIARRMNTASSEQHNRNNRERRLSVPNIRSSSDNPPELSRTNSQQEKTYPPAPVATLTVTPDSATLPKLAGCATVPPPPGERIPLWALAPGVGILHGSTSASIGVRLGDFSAINLTETTDATRPKSTSMPSSLHAPSGLITPSMTFQTTKNPSSTLISAQNPTKAFIPPVEAPLRPITPSKALGTSAIPVKAVLSNGGTQIGPAIHLTPPDQAPVRLMGVEPGSWEGERSDGTQSWPSPVNKPSGWRRGGKEKMEDTLDSLAVTGSVTDTMVNHVTQRVQDMLLEKEELLAQRSPGSRTSELLALV